MENRQNEVTILVVKMSTLTNKCMASKGHRQIRLKDKFTYVLAILYKTNKDQNEAKCCNKT